MVWTSAHTRLVLILVPGPVLLVLLMVLLYTGALKNAYRGIRGYWSERPPSRWRQMWMGRKQEVYIVDSEKQLEVGDFLYSQDETNGQKLIVKQP